MWGFGQDAVFDIHRVWGEVGVDWKSSRESPDWVTEALRAALDPSCGKILLGRWGWGGLEAGAPGSQTLHLPLILSISSPDYTAKCLHAEVSMIPSRAFLLHGET